MGQRDLGLRHFAPLHFIHGRGRFCFFTGDLSRRVKLVALQSNDGQASDHSTHIHIRRTLFQEDSND